MSISDKLTTIAENVPKVYEAGQKSEYDRFWDTIQNNGNRRNYEYTFFRFPYALYDPKYDFVFGGQSSYSANSAFRSNDFIDLKRNSDFTNLPGAIGLMYTCTDSKKLVNARTFKVTANIKYQGTFSNCTGLVEIRFEGVIGQNGLSFQYSTKLSKASIESVINHLSDTTTELTVTFSKTAVDNAFETSAGAADGTTSQEWADLIATKSNWTISLV